MVCLSLHIIFYFLVNYKNDEVLTYEEKSHFLVTFWLGIILLSFGVLTASTRVPLPHLATVFMLLSLGAIYGFSVYMGNYKVCNGDFGFTYIH